jgi:hypothetical protein
MLSSTPLYCVDGPLCQYSWLTTSSQLRPCAPWQLIGPMTCCGDGICRGSWQLIVCNVIWLLWCREWPSNEVCGDAQLRKGIDRSLDIHDCNATVINGVFMSVARAVISFVAKQWMHKCCLAYVCVDRGWTVHLQESSLHVRVHQPKLIAAL